MILKGNTLLIKRDEPETKTAGGIFIPDALISKRNTGTVVMLGDTADKKFKGKHVMFQSVAGEAMDYEGEAHLLIFAIEVIAIKS